MSLKLLLLLICCTCWTITYLVCIKTSLQQKTYAVPFYAMVLNITWESYNTYHGAKILGTFHVTSVFNAIGFILDCFILFTYLKFGKEKSESKIIFYLRIIVSILLGYTIQYVFGVLFGFSLGALYVSYFINLAMSALFVKMFFDRKGTTQGQSLWIAVNKCIGTLCATVLVGYLGIWRLGGAFPIIGYTGILIFFIDVYYIHLLYRAKKQSA